jgi:GalNAc-alpha-(1->4)-GalNAc-alpha-(1->3)-diNAcBac-PP-undecaprenol alpha-1,4-N-acetyl-D-galactosaminyltransferase
MLPAKVNNQKKIVMILPTLHPGGMERVMSELANYFSLHEFGEVHFILFNPKAVIFYPLHSNVKVHLQSKPWKQDNKFFGFFYTLNFIRSTIKSINPQVVLSFGTQWNNLVLLSLIRTGIRVFVSDRGAPDRRYKFHQELLRSILYPVSTGIVAQTSLAFGILTNRFPKANIRVIGNPIRQVSGEGKRNKTILSIGRLISSKHHDRLIRLFATLNAPDWTLCIIGGDALKQQNMTGLQILVDELGLTGRVNLLGFRQDVDDFYLSSSMFAFTSSVEGFPNVVGEALSAGLPVVSYNCVAGPAEMIEDGVNGFLVDVFDDILFAKRLQFLIDNPLILENMSKDARLRIKKFSMEKIAEDYWNFMLP